MPTRAAGARIFVLLGVWLTTGLLTGCSGQPEAPIRLATNPWPGFDFLHLAADKGFFAAEGVSVRLVEFMSLGDARRAFERGQVDGFAGTLSELLLARENSRRRPRIFFVTDYSNGADVLVARKSLASVADLRGRRIGVEPATMDLIVLMRALATAQLTLQDVQLVPLATQEKPAVFARGEVDAVTAYPPTSVAILGGGQAHVLFDSSQIPGEIVDILAADEEHLARRPQAFARLLRAFERARRFADDHPDEAHALMADHERISVADFRSDLGKIMLFPLAEQAPFFAPGSVLLTALRHTDQSLRELGLLKGPPPDDTVLTSEPVHRALAP